MPEEPTFDTIGTGDVWHVTGHSRHVLAAVYHTSSIFTTPTDYQEVKGALWRLLRHAAQSIPSTRAMSAKWPTVAHEPAIVPSLVCSAHDAAQL